MNGKGSHILTAVVTMLVTLISGWVMLAGRLVSRQDVEDLIVLHSKVVAVQIETVTRSSDAATRELTVISKETATVREQLAVMSGKMDLVLSQLQQKRP